jgi:hypothetical protein
MKAKYLASLACLLIGSSIALAKECADSRSCAVFANGKGEIVYHADGHDTVLLKADANNASTYTTYVSGRSQKYYLIRESETNDHSLIIVPIDVDGTSASFSKLLFLSIDLMKSTQSGHEVWSGSEIDLDAPSRFSQFSWDKAYAWQSKLPTTRSASNNLAPVPTGFSSASVTIYKDGGKAGTRTFVYQNRQGLTPDSIVCYSNCDVPAEPFDGGFIGTVGKYPVHAYLSQKVDRVSGYYSYDGKPGKLYLSGTAADGKSASIGEYEKEGSANETARFDITQLTPHIAGTWISGRTNAKLPVILFRDTIF